MKFYGEDLELSVLFEKYFKHINTVKKYHEKKCESKFSDYRHSSISKFEEDINSKKSSLSVSKRLTKIDKTDLLVSSDYKIISFSISIHSGLKNKQQKQSI